MDIRNILWVVIACIMMLSCNKDDVPAQPPGPDPTPENRAPEAFELLFPEDGADRELLRPEFSWQTAIDPDGNAVTYDLYVGEGSEPDSLVAKGILETRFTPTDDLALFGTYSWKVVARDTKKAEKSSAISGFVVDPVLYLKKFSEACAHDGIFSEFNYDVENRLVELTHYYHGGVEGKLMWTYDAREKLKRLTNQEGRSQSFFYNELGHNYSIEDRDENDEVIQTTLLEYDSMDRIIGAQTTGRQSGFVSYDISYSGDSNVPDRISSATTPPVGWVLKRRLDLEWDSQGNLVKRVEWSARGDDPFVKRSEATYSYDQLKNPLYPIFEQFRLPVFHYRTGLDFSEILYPFEWIGKHNITVENRTQFGGRNLYKVEREYEYNNEGYPIKVIDTSENAEACFDY